MSLETKFGNNSIVHRTVMEKIVTAAENEKKNSTIRYFYHIGGDAGYVVDAVYADCRVSAVIRPMSAPEYYLFKNGQVVSHLNHENYTPTAHPLLKTHRDGVEAQRLQLKTFACSAFEIPQGYCRIIDG